MFFALWSRLRYRKQGASAGKPHRGPQRPLFRPQCESLEDRVVPSLASGAPLAITGGSLIASVSAFSQQMQVMVPVQSSARTNEMRVTLPENSAATVIDLAPVFGKMPGINPGDGLRLSILGNTNSQLVKADLSESSLTLTCARGHYGTATITVGATDADGVSAQETIIVTVLPVSWL